jgi:hypothetical protein
MQDQMADQAKAKVMDRPDGVYKGLSMTGRAGIGKRTRR